MPDRAPPGMVCSDTMAPAAGSRPRLRTWAVLAAGAVILFLRCPDRVLHPQFWAEDGIFFYWAREGGWRMPGVQLAGYLQVAPRLIGALAQLVDPVWAPHIFVACAFAGTLYVMARALSERCPLPCRPAVAGAIILVPDASEILLHAGNVQWIFSAGLLLLLLSADARSRTGQVHDGLAATLFGLSGPFGLLLAPLFVARACFRRTAASTWLASIVTATAALQLGVILAHPQPLPAPARFDWQALVAFPALRLGRELFLRRLFPSGWTWPVAAVATVGVLVFVGWLAGGRGVSRRERLYLGAAFAALLASTIYRCRYTLPDLCSAPSGERYLYPLEVILLWLLLARASDPRRPVRLVGAGAAALAALSAVTAFRIAPAPDRHWREEAGPLRHGRAATVTINPGWTFHFPARR